jgi:ribosomal protein L21
MSELERILKLAGSQAKVETPSPAPEATQREMKPVAQEAVGEFAEPIYDLIDMHFEGDCQPVFDDLVRYLSGDQIEDFVADFRRNHDLNDMDDDMDEAQQLNASDYSCEDCGDTMHQPTTDCGHDCDDETGSWWKDKDGNGVPDSLEEAPNEGNEFSGELAKAKAAGKKEFEVDGKKYKVESEEADTDAEELEEEVEEVEELEEVAVAEDDKEELEESPTMDTTQLVNMMKNAGLSEEAINEKLNEWANSGDHVNGDPEVIGEPYENFAQSVNTSLKRYLDAEDMKVGLKEHTVEELKEAYKAKKEQ